MVLDNTVRDQLRNVKFEAIKLYRVYDSNGRLQTQFESWASTEDGGPCLRTDYGYDGGSSRIIKLKESPDVWQSAWDL